MQPHNARLAHRVGRMGVTGGGEEGGGWLRGVDGWEGRRAHTVLSSLLTTLV